MLDSHIVCIFSEVRILLYINALSLSVENLVWDLVVISRLSYSSCPSLPLHMPSPSYPRRDSFMRASRGWDSLWAWKTFACMSLVRQCEQSPVSKFGVERMTTRTRQEGIRTLPPWVELGPSTSHFRCGKSSLSTIVSDKCGRRHCGACTGIHHAQYWNAT